MESIPLYWRLQKHTYRLIGKKCSSCGSLYYPPQPLCSECRRKGKLEDIQFSGRGEILSYTIIRVPPEGFEHHGPYAVAIIKLEEGPTISGQIVNGANSLETIEIGKKVRTVFRKIREDGSRGVIQYGVKWEIVE